MNLTRRRFLKLATAAGAAGTVGLPEAARASTATGGAARAMLVDTTRCVGCRGCEAACSEANGLAPPAAPGTDDVFARRREPDQRTFTVVNRFARSDGSASFIKRQCMHCVQPGCASACPVRALEKTSEGPVVYHKERCIGCRYCMVACPFGGPKYEYDKAAPYVQKCSFCAERQKRGQPPACAAVCPTGALQFGTRAELLEVARGRIYRDPDRYQHHVYGEHEVGGTSWLYLAAVPFETLGMDTGVGETPYPDLTRGALGAVPFVMTLWPPLLAGLYAFARRRDEVAARLAGAGKGKEDRHG